eukprot:SAG31_NODE_639_length_13309_cov_4.008468_6_plen_101_part_00
MLSTIIVPPYCKCGFCCHVGQIQATAAATAAIANVDDADTWEYKISINDQQVHGPFSSEHMQAWMDQGYFKEKPVWVRRVSKQQKQDFKSSDEIDMFSMY